MIKQYINFKKNISPLSVLHLTNISSQFVLAIVVVQSLSRILLIATPWTAALQASLSFYHHLEFAQTHVHWVGDAIQPSHPLLSPSPPSIFPSIQVFCSWISSSHQVAKVLELQLQHQSFQWIFRVDFF